MHHRSGISLCKFLCRNPNRISPRPTSPILGHSTTQIPSQLDPDTGPVSSKSSFLTEPYSNLLTFPYPSGSNAENCVNTGQSLRKLSSNSGSDSTTEVDVNEEVDKINLKFAEAREEIEMAMESKETVYFDEEAECARAAVKEVVDMFDGLLGKLPESQKAAVQRSMGLKIEQLKAELQQLND